jgi:peptide/nickel transport system substrate-binding protein
MEKKLLFRWTLPFFLVLTLILASSAARSEEPKYGGTLTFTEYAPNVNPMSWDNAAWNWKHGYDTGFYLEHLMMGDLQKGPRGKKLFTFDAAAWIPPDVVRGELLERWEVNKKDLKIVLYLRKGVFWQEKPGVMKSRELVADDVVYSMERLMKSPKRVPDQMDFIERWEAKDKYTVVVHLKHWVADWQFRIGWGYYEAIQPPEMEKAPGGAARWENACGTGPFMLTEYKEGHSQIYQRNPNYWGSELFGKKSFKLPFVDKLIMLLVRDEQTLIAALRTGKVDLAFNINPRYVDELKKNVPQLKWARHIQQGNLSLALRMDTKPFDDIRVRKALNMAINRKEMIKTLFHGQAEIHSYPFPPTFKEVYTPLEKLPPAAQEVYTYNPEKAKKLLAEAGYPKGFSFKATVVTAPNMMEAASMVVAYLAKIGVNLELVPMDYPSSMSQMLKRAHPAGFFLRTDHSSPFAGIQKNFFSDSPWNPHMMKDPYVEKTWEEAWKNPNLSEKEGFEVIKKLAVYCLEQVPAVILPTNYTYTVWWPWVKNYYGEFRVGAQRSGPILARVWIDQDLKKKMGF